MGIWLGESQERKPICKVKGENGKVFEERLKLPADFIDSFVFLASELSNSNGGNAKFSYCSSSKSIWSNPYLNIFFFFLFKLGNKESDGVVIMWKKIYLIDSMDPIIVVESIFRAIENEEIRMEEKELVLSKISKLVLDILIYYCLF